MFRREPLVKNTIFAHLFIHFIAFASLYLRSHESFQRTPYILFLFMKWHSAYDICKGFDKALDTNMLSWKVTHIFLV